MWVEGTKQQLFQGDAIFATVQAHMFHAERQAVLGCKPGQGATPGLKLYGAVGDSESGIYIPDVGPLTQHGAPIKSCLAFP